MNKNNRKVIVNATIHSYMHLERFLDLSQLRWEMEVAALCSSYKDPVK